MADIMIIDDDAAIRRILKRVLEAAGHSIREAGDGKTALRHFAGNPADLVISDIYMPDMGGIEFLTRVREAFPDAKIIAMSGGGPLAKDRVLGAASVLGAVDVMEKPLTVEEVERTVERALAGSEGSAPD